MLLKCRHEFVHVIGFLLFFVLGFRRLIPYNRLIFEKNVLLVLLFLKLKVCSVHCLTLHSLKMTIWPPVNCSFIFLSEQMKLNQSCIACALLSNSTNSNYNVKRYSEISHWKNISKEIDKAMEWFKWLTWLFHLVVALFFFYCHTLFFIRI